MAGNTAKYMLQVSNIPWTIGSHQLALYFSQFGYLHKAVVVFDKHTGLSKNYGYITFIKKEHMNSVLEKEHALEGKKLSVTLPKILENLNNDTVN